MYSYHNFMFPFRFDKVSCEFNGDDRHEFYKEVKFDDRVVIDDEFKKNLENNGWEYKKFEINSSLDYNEFVYFHDFVKDSLYNLKEFEVGATSYYFEKKDINNKFNLIIKGKEYDLKLTSISLRIFDTGIGILSIEAENHENESLEDILKINDFARRVYPQFLGENFDVSKTQEAFLPSKIKIDKYEENFSNFADEVKQKPFVKIGNHILGILGDTFSQTFKKDKYLIQPILDDRMFLVCLTKNKDLENKLINNNYETNDDWYKYVFVDSSEKTVFSNNMQTELIIKSTYDRWMDYKWGLTLFGITRYSFVALSGNSLLENHIKTMYYQMATILLATRASILRFSDEITAISDISDNPSDRIENLYKNYLRFKNKLYFKEITAQEQGLELYDKAREIMRIDSDINDLAIEISSLNNFAFVLDEKEEKKEMNKLTKLGTIFIPGTFIAGIFGMNVFPEKALDNIVGTLFAFFLISIITYIITKNNNIDLLSFIKNGKLEDKKNDSK